jgi:hypothetical protein
MEWHQDRAASVERLVAVKPPVATYFIDMMPPTTGRVHNLAEEALDASSTLFKMAERRL